jgi:serine acetyltransferase
VDADVTIGNNVRLGPNVTILGSGRIFSNKNVPIVEQGYTHKGVTIGDDVLIGAGAIILDGCKISDGAVSEQAVWWIRMSRHIPFPGAPARVVWKGYRGSSMNITETIKKIDK